MRVVSAPPLQFKCKHCGATNEGEAHEFRDLNTSPPMWAATCGHCNLENRVYISALAARLVGSRM